MCSNVLVNWYYLLIWLRLSPTLGESWAQVMFQAERSSFSKGEGFTPRSFVPFQTARSLTRKHASMEVQSLLARRLELLFSEQNARRVMGNV
ncbi:MAG TPA: hypothetical protein V6D50_25855 [Chroococcales cyanobacterium]